MDAGVSEEKVAEQLKFHHTINGKLLIPKRKQHEEFCFRNRRGGRLSDGSIQPLDKGTSQFLSTRNPFPIDEELQHIYRVRGKDESDFIFSKKPSRTWSSPDR